MNMLALMFIIRYSGKVFNVMIAHICDKWITKASTNNSITKRKIESKFSCILHKTKPNLWLGYKRFSHNLIKNIQF